MPAVASTASAGIFLALMPARPPWYALQNASKINQKLYDRNNTR